MAVKSYRPPVVCLLGPTASGKTQLAMDLAEIFPFSLISVDSTLVYKGMDIGSAKPTRDQRAKHPHALIDVCELAETYSAGRFVSDAKAHIHSILQANRIPLLVGGTMLYFHALQQGLSALPVADPHLRSELSAEAARIGWPALHAQLEKLVPARAAQIHPHDATRIQRALEIYYSGAQIQPPETVPEFRFINLLLIPQDRQRLRTQIALRFNTMLHAGLVAEVQPWYEQNPELRGSTSQRAVGYKQVWAYLAGEINEEEMCSQAISATAQLAKRQITWLKSWPTGSCWQSEQPKLLASLQAHLSNDLAI